MKTKYIILLPLVMLFVACTKDASIPECSIKITKESVLETYTRCEMVFGVYGTTLNVAVSCLLVPANGGEVVALTTEKIDNCRYKLSYSDVNGFNYDARFVLTTNCDVYNHPKTIKFKTKDFQAPEVVTGNVEDVETTVTYHGLVRDNGGRNLSEYGFCFCHGEGTPTLDDFVVTSSDMSYENRFSYNVTLEHGRTYTVRAYAKNDIGLGYGEPVTFQKK